MDKPKRLAILTPPGSKLKLSLWRYPAGSQFPDGTTTYFTRNALIRGNRVEHYSAQHYIPATWAKVRIKHRIKLAEGQVERLTKKLAHEKQELEYWKQALIKAEAYHAKHSGPLKLPRK